MKKYNPNKYLKEGKPKQVLFYRDCYVFDVNHSVARYKERVGREMFIYEKLLKKGINWIIDNKKEWEKERYIFISKKYGFGIQVDWREDHDGELKGLHGWSATTFSNDEMHYFKKDKELFLENIRLTESAKRANDIYEKGYARFEAIGELKQELYECMIDKYVQSGEIFYTVEIIEL